MLEEKARFWRPRCSFVGDTRTVTWEITSECLPHTPLRANTRC